MHKFFEGAVLLLIVIALTAVLSFGNNFVQKYYLNRSEALRTTAELQEDLKQTFIVGAEYTVDDIRQFILAQDILSDYPGTMVMLKGSDGSSYFFGNVDDLGEPYSYGNYAKYEYLAHTYSFSKTQKVSNTSVYYYFIVKE